MTTQGYGRQVGDMDGEITLVITREEALAGVQRAARFHGPDGREYTIPVDIPAGVQPGTRLRVADMAGVGYTGWACGDLVVVIAIVPNQRSEYRDADIHLTVQVDRATALREQTLQVPIGGERVVTVPVEGNVSRARFVYPGLGLPRGYAPRRYGNLVLHLELLDVAPAYTEAVAQPAGAQPPRRWWQTLFGA